MKYSNEDEPLLEVNEYLVPREWADEYRTKMLAILNDLNEQLDSTD